MLWTRTGIFSCCRYQIADGKDSFNIKYLRWQKRNSLRRVLFRHSQALFLCGGLSRQGLKAHQVIVGVEMVFQQQLSLC